MTLAPHELPLLAALKSGVILLDAQGRVLHWNAWFAEQLRTPQPDYAQRTLNELFPNIVGTRLAACIDQALHSHLSSMLTPGLNPPVLPLFHKAVDVKTGIRMHQLIHITAMRHPEIACLIQIQDMTAAIKRERKLRVQSMQMLDATHRDALTGVSNRRRFDLMLPELFMKAQQTRTSISLLMIDVDQFKNFNDRHGQERGDEALRIVAQALDKGLRRESGDALCRYGGEEFAVLLPDSNEATACSIAERLRQRVEDLDMPHETTQDSTPLAVSIGLATLKPQESQAEHVLITGAELALYQAKEEGGNRCMRYCMQSNEICPLP